MEMRLRKEKNNCTAQVRPWFDLDFEIPHYMKGELSKYAQSPSLQGNYCSILMTCATRSFASVGGQGDCERK